MIRCLGAFIVLLIAALGPTGPAAAQALRVFASDFPPYAFEDQGRAAGTTTDRVREILGAAGQVAIIEIYPWARAYRAARATPGALLYPVARTPEREHEFKWLGELINYDVWLWRLADRRDIVMSKLPDAAGLSIGGLPDDAKTRYLQAEGMSVSLQSNEEILLTMLVNGRIDLMAADRISFLDRLQRHGLNPNRFVPALAIPEMSGPLYLAINPDADPALVEKLTAAFGPTGRFNH